MKEMKSYLKERQTFLNKLARAQKQLAKSTTEYEIKLANSDINCFQCNLAIIEETIEKIKFNGEKY